MVVDGHIFHHN